MLKWIMVILSNLYFILNIIDVIFIFFDNNAELIILIIGGMILFIFPYADFWKFWTSFDNNIGEEENDNEKNKRSVYYYNNESKND